MVAIATPMNEDGSLDFGSLEQLIEFHIDNKTDVIISVGTTGESATLDFDPTQYTTTGQRAAAAPARCPVSRRSGRCPCCG